MGQWGFFASKTMDIYKFMALMLFFLPEKHSKMIRYYGIYAKDIEHKLRIIQQRTWKMAIEHSFNENPEICLDCARHKCPDCSHDMVADTVYSSLTDKEIKALVKTHVIIKGYFRPLKRPP
jgi:hypothetical protein